MPRIPQNLRERGIGMLDAGMSKDRHMTFAVKVALNPNTTNQPIDTLGSVFKQQGVLKTAIFGTPICATASKLSQLLWFYATLTAKVISWWSVTHMCFPAFPHKY